VGLAGYLLSAAVTGGISRQRAGGDLARLGVPTVVTVMLLDLPPVVTLVLLTVIVAVGVVTGSPCTAPASADRQGVAHRADHLPGPTQVLVVEEEGDGGLSPGDPAYARCRSTPVTSRPARPSRCCPVPPGQLGCLTDALR
jgi:hypothetical protein